MKWTAVYSILILVVLALVCTPSDAFGFHIISQRPLRTRTETTESLTRLHQQSSNNLFHPRDGQQREGHHRLFSSSSLSSSFRTALCIIPPDESWDTLQRARHFAQDHTYNQWPPAIRLFHPFCSQSQLSNVALDVATIVEKHNIKPFPITLNQWTVMPLPTNHYYCKRQTTMHDDDDEQVVDEMNSDSPSLMMTEEDLAIQELIANEERKGRERKKQRELRKLRKQQEKEGSFANSTATQLAINTLLEELEQEQQQASLEKQQQQQPGHEDDDDDNEFNGPAMIALEPDDKSSRKLRHLRELLRLELQAEFDTTTPTTNNNAPESSPIPAANHQIINEEQEEDWVLDDYQEEADAFRPLVPIGTFPTTDAALTTARKLKGLWDPLTFQVTDLHCISQPVSYQQQLQELGRQQQQHDVRNLYHHQQHQQNHPVVVVEPTTTATTTDAAAATTNNNRRPKQSNMNNILQNTEFPFGCDALVMLMGEEIEQDEEANDILAQKIWVEGTPGGYERQQNSDAATSVLSENDVEEDELLAAEEGCDSRMWSFDDFERQLDVKEGEWEDLLDWLDGDEDDEEFEIGTTVVIGRTHMFSGETRRYAGMPASSIGEEERNGLGNSLGSDSFLWKDSMGKRMGQSGYLS